MQKGGGAINVINGQISSGRKGQGGGSAESMRWWRGGKRERRGQPDGARRQGKKILGGFGYATTDEVLV